MPEIPKPPTVVAKIPIRPVTQGTIPGAPGVAVVPVAGPPGPAGGAPHVGHTEPASPTEGSLWIIPRTQIPAGIRAMPGTVGYLGDPDALFRLNPGDSFVGTVFEGTSTNWVAGFDVLEVRGSGLVIDGYEINATVVHASGVDLTIRNSIIRAPQGESVVVTNTGPTNGLMLIEDTTIIGTPGPGTTVIPRGAATDGKLIMRRCDVSGVTDAVHVCGYQGSSFADGSLISQCYFHDLSFTDAVNQHADVVQCYVTHSGYSTAGGQTWLTIEHCDFDLTVGPAGVAYSAGFTMGQAADPGAPTMAVKVDNNRIAYGAYHLRMSDNLNNCVVTNNELGFRHVIHDEFGLSDIFPNTVATLTWTNNKDGNGNVVTYNVAGPNAPAPGARTALMRIRSSSRWLSLITEEPTDIQTPEFAGIGSAYVHVQSSASSNWVINHNLGHMREPTVLLDSAPTVPVLTDVTHGSLNQTTITFPTPVTGKAYF